MEILKSASLVLGTTLVLVIVGLPAFIAIWIVVLGLFGYSRVSTGAVVFSDWSWPRFLVTLGFGLGVPYALLLSLAGF